VRSGERFVCNTHVQRGSVMALACTLCGSVTLSSPALVLAGSPRSLALLARWLSYWLTGSRTQPGDVLTMQLDTERGSLVFWVNGAGGGAGFTAGVGAAAGAAAGGAAGGGAGAGAGAGTTRLRLRWAVSMCYKGNSAEIVPDPAGLLAN
jgi:hypothetical protein